MAKRIRIKKIRPLIQGVFTLVSNSWLPGYFRGTIYTGSSKSVCFPGLNCYSCPGALGACPLGALQASLNSAEFKLALYVAGFLIAVGAVLGRFVCGFLCPFGWIQELLHKIPVFKKRKKLKGERYLRLLKYVVLAVFVLLLPLFVVDITGLGKPWFCTYICPSGTLMGGIPLVLANPMLRQAVGFLYAWKLLILFLLSALSLVIWRPFCRYLCPLGAIYGCFNPVALVRFRIDPQKCVSCGACQAACPMELPVWQKPNGMECVRCGACQKACPYGAIETTVPERGRNKARNSEERL